jgi:hypothetical protein
LLKKASNEDVLDCHFILRKLQLIGNKKELSFTSKVLATVDPKLPIWDSKVRKRVNEIGGLNLKQSYSSIEDCVEAYNSMVKWYRKFMKTPKAKAMVKKFDAHFPDEKITSIKKVDFMLWQTIIK